MIGRCTAAAIGRDRMPRTKQAAADYIERHDAEMRIILGELAEVSHQIATSGRSVRARS